MIFGINFEEVYLADFALSFTFKSISGLAPPPLQDTENDDVQSLVQVHGVGWVAEHFNFVLAHILNKTMCIMRVVSINK